MTDNEVEAFLVLYECHSISRASERLFISQSALSLRIKALEDEIGEPLFLRGKGQRTVEPSVLGRDFYELALRYNETVKKMKHLSAAGSRERLRVCCFDSINHYLFRPVYENFMNACPDAVLEMQDMSTNSAYQSVMRGETDLVFTPRNLSSREVKCKPLFKEKMVFLCSADSDYPELLRLDDINARDEVFIAWSQDISRWHRYIFGEEDVYRYSLAATRNLTLFLQKKNCWMLAPATVARGLLKETDRITTRSLAFTLPDRPTVCLYRESALENPLIEQFMKALEPVLTGLEKDGLITRT